MAKVALLLQTSYYDQAGKLTAKTAYEADAAYYQDDNFYYLDYFLAADIKCAYQLAYNKEEFLIKGRSEKQNINIYGSGNKGSIKILTAAGEIRQDFIITHYQVDSTGLLVAYQIYDSAKTWSSVSYKVTIEKEK